MDTAATADLASMAMGYSVWQRVTLCFFFFFFTFGFETRLKLCVKMCPWLFLTVSSSIPECIFCVLTFYEIQANIMDFETLYSVHTSHATGLAFLLISLHLGQFFKNIIMSLTSLG